MSDSEASDIERYQRSKDRELLMRAGLTEGPQSEDDFEFSDEEVMGLSGTGSSDEDQEEYYETGRGGASKEREGWGASRDNYYGGADDEDQESGQEDEEQEALRIQRKQAERMDDQDYYDEDDVDGWKKSTAAFEEIAAAEPTAVDPSKLDAIERRSLIEEAYPEVILLSKELEVCKAAKAELEAAALDDVSPTIRQLKEAALGSYMGMLYAYFALFSSKVNQGVVDLKNHPVMEGILKARELWRLAQGLGDEEPVEYADSDVSGISAADSGLENMTHKIEPSAESGSELSEDFSGSGSEYDELSESEDENDKVEEEDDFNIAFPSKAARPQRKSKRTNDFDETADSVELQARARSKQSLRFYTSAIGKRDAESKQSQYSGDVDLPYKERAFERRQRLLEAARQRGLESKDELGSESDSENRHGASQNPLYTELKNASAVKKATKRQRHDDAVAAAKEGRLQEFMADESTGDKRALNYQIQKNKGLTPKRRKENRNARVKKRVRYAEAQKKLKGVRAVYKQPTSAYGGEMTGIRKNLVHSRKF